MRILTLIFIVSFTNSYSRIIEKVDGDSKFQNYKSSILLTGHIATNTRVGGKYIGSIIKKNYLKYTLGFNLAAEKPWFTDNITLPHYTTIDVKYGIIGMYFRYQITEQFFF